MHHLAGDLVSRVLAMTKANIKAENLKMNQEDPKKHPIYTFEKLQELTHAERFFVLPGTKHETLADDVKGMLTYLHAKMDRRFEPVTHSAGISTEIPPTFPAKFHLICLKHFCSNF